MPVLGLRESVLDDVMVFKEVAVNVVRSLTIVPLAVFKVRSLVPPEEMVPAPGKLREVDVSVT